MYYKGHRKRLREKLLHYPAALADYEILELLLGYVLLRQDTKPLAKELLKTFGSLYEIFSAPEDELGLVKGFGPALKAFFLLLKEVQARRALFPVPKKQLLANPDAVGEMAIARIGNSKKEEVWIVLLDKQNQLISFEQLSKGTVDRAPLYVREVITLALHKSASGVILVHNHPTGNLTPSGADIAITEKVYVATCSMGIKLLDHIIVTENNYLSFQATGQMPISSNVE